MAIGIWPWVLFNGFVLVMLALDLGVFHRKDHAVSLKEAALWSGVWVSLALLFNAGLYWFIGTEPALQFLTGYLIEKSLSVDNIFVFVLLFSYFQVPAAYQHRVLFWGILGALLMRGALIGLGAYLLVQFHWIFYLFGGLLVWMGARMALEKSDKARKIDVERNVLVRLLRRVLPVTSDFRSGNFFVHENGRRFATPLLLVLIAVESTDLLFALDSVPAVFAVTRDPFLVYSSNVFAILGLRSLYFLLAGVITKFHYLKPGLAIILIFVGMKMLLTDIYHMPIVLSLGVIASILGISIGASLLLPGQKPQIDMPADATRLPVE